MPPATGRTRVRGPLLWFGVLGGMFAWAAHLLASYAVVPIVCRTGQEVILHLLTIGTGGVAAASVAAAWISHRRLHRAGMDSTHPDPTNRGETGPPTHRGAEEDVETRRLHVRKFLALGGLAISTFFLALILVEALPTFLQEDPCRHIPIQDSPIILLERAGAILSCRN